MGELGINDRVRLSGGYFMEEEWLGGLPFVDGSVAGWIPGQNAPEACVVELDAPLTAEGPVGPDISQREQLTGRYVVLELRHVGATWGPEGIVHVELISDLPESKKWGDRPNGAWIEAAASYRKL